MVELPGRRLTPANDTFTAPVEEVERGELAPVQAAPTVTENVTQPETVTETVTESVTEDVAPPTETPPLPTQDYDRWLMETDPAVKEYMQKLKAWEAQGEEEPTPTEDLPDPMKKTLTSIKNDAAKENASTRRLDLEAKASQNKTNASTYAATEADIQEGKKKADEEKGFLDGFWTTITGLASDVQKSMYIGDDLQAVLKDPDNPLGDLISGAAYLWLRQWQGEGQKGALRGYLGMKEVFGGGLRQYGETLDSDFLRNLGDRAVAEGKSLRENKFLVPRIKAFTEIKGESWFQDSVDYISSKAGEGVGNMAAIGAMYAGLGSLSAAGFMVTISVGEVRNALVEEGITDEGKIATYAYSAGLVIAALEKLFPDGVAQGLKEATKKKIAIGIAKAMARGAIKGGVTEGTTEALQEAVQIAAVAHAKDGKSLLDMDPLIDAFSKGATWERLIEAAISGAVPGTLIGTQAGATQAGISQAAAMESAAERGRGLLTPGTIPSPALPEEERTEEASSEAKPEAAAPLPPSDNPDVEAVRERILGRMEAPEAPAEAAPVAEEMLPVGEEPPPIMEIPEAPEAPEDIIQAAQEILGEDFADAEPQQIAEAVGQAADLAAENIPDIDAVNEMVNYVREAQAVPQPKRLAQFLVEQGGVVDEGGDVRSLMGDTRGRPGLVSGRGLPLDEAAQRAWDAGYLPGIERPDINALKTALQEDLGTAPRFSEIDSETVADLNTAEEMRQGLEQLGITINDTPEVIAQKLAEARQGAQNLRDTADAAVAAVEQIEEQAQEEAAREVTDEDRQRFNDVLAGKTVRSRWAEEAGVTEEKLGTLIDEALADGRLQMRGDKPVRARKRIEAQESARLVEMAQERTEEEPGELSPDLAAGQRVQALPTSFQRNYARALYKAGTNEYEFRQALAAIRDDKNMTARQVVEIAEAYVGRRPGATFRQRRTAVEAMTAEFTRRVQAAQRASLNGTSLEVEGANLALNEDVRTTIMQMAERMDPGQTFGVEIRKTLRALTGEAAAGLYDPAKNLVAVALEYGVDDALSTFTHETIHALRHLGLLKGKAWDVLVSATQRVPVKREALRILDRLERSKVLRRDRANQLRQRAGELTYRELYDIDRRYTKLAEQMAADPDETRTVEEILVEEAVAHIAEDWKDGRDHGTRVERIMNRVEDYIQALRNFFEFGSLQSVNQVFDNVFSGETARRSLAEFATKRRGGGFGQWSSPSFRGIMASLRAWHGSPARFTRFSMEFLGRNDGQAYGYGLYFAENIETAKSYKPRDFDLERWAYEMFTAAERAEDYNQMEAWERIMLHETPDEIRAFAHDYATDEDYIDAFFAVADLVEKRLQDETTKGALYQVKLHVEPEELIDWDAPISEQPQAIQEAIKNLIGMNEEAREDWRDRLLTDLAENGPLGYDSATLERAIDEAFQYGGYGPEFDFRVWDEILEAAPNLGRDFQRAVTQSGAGLDPSADLGATLYNAVASNYVNPHDIMAAFLETGIKGIQFWDQGSRSAGDGTRNYVMFDTSLIEIIDVNGQPVDDDARAGVLDEMEVGEDPHDRGRQNLSMRLQRQGYIPIEDLMPDPDRPPPPKLLAYHATTSRIDYDRFDISFSEDIGMHFGSVEQANDRVGDGSYWNQGPARVFPVGIEVQNPLTMPDLGDWRPYQMWRYLVRQGIVEEFTPEGGVTPLQELVEQDAEEYAIARIPPEAYADPQSKFEAHDAAIGELRRMQYAGIRAAIEAAGYDGIRYMNEHEGLDYDNPYATNEEGDPIGGWAYILWKPGQVTSATSGRVMLSMREVEPVSFKDEDDLVRQLEASFGKDDGVFESLFAAIQEMNGDQVKSISRKFAKWGAPKSKKDALSKIWMRHANILKADLHERAFGNRIASSASLREADPGLLDNGDHVDRISTRFPTQMQSTEDPLTERLAIDQNAMRETPDAYKFNAGIVRGYVNWPKSNKARNPDKVFEDMKTQIKSNLMWLYNQVPPEIRQQSKNWYDGARIITDQWSADFNQPPRAIAGVLAALSPGKDWYANVSMGERLLDIWTYKQDHKWDGKMTRTANRVVFVDKKTGEEKTLVKPELLKQIKGKTLAGLVAEGNLTGAAALIRVYDETYNDGMLRVVNATGEFIGDPQQKINWQSYALIAKAVSVLVDPSYENISRAMGEAHKIRNFYNNILAPNARFGDVTIDTHAIAAALLRPLAQKSTEVAHGLGTSPPPGIQNVKHAGKSGAKGLYGLYADAYREAAQELQILPRELQSITWEAVRGLYPRAWKRDENVAGIDAIWKEYKDGRISLGETRSRILDYAGGIDDPSWYRPDGAVAAEQFDTSYEGELSRARVSGRPPKRVRPAAGRGGRGRAARGASNRRNYSLREPAIDQLGFYSAALEAAHNLKQEKGTPEQMLSQILKSPGVREAELNQAGLASALEGRKSVTKDEIIEILEFGKIRLREQVYQLPDPKELEKARFLINIDDEQLSVEQAIARVPNAEDQAVLLSEWHRLRPGGRLESVYDQDQFIQSLMSRLRADLTAGFSEWHRISQQSRLLLGQNPQPKWAVYSLDKDNPTYKETTVYVPPAPQSLKFEVDGGYVDELDVADWPVFGEGLGDERFVGRGLWQGKEEVSGVKEVRYRIGDASPIDGEIVYWPSVSKWPDGVFQVSSLNIQNAHFGTLEEAKQYIEADYNENRETLADRSDVYVGSHFKEPNIVVHLRTAEHPDEDGNKHLVLNEAQSDYGQDYRDYQINRPDPAEVQANIGRLTFLTQEYDRVSEVWYDLQKTHEEIGEWNDDVTSEFYKSLNIPDEFAAPLRDDAIERAKKALAEQNDTTVEEIENELYGFTDEMDYVNAIASERSRLHAEILQLYQNIGVNNPDAVTIARRRRDQAWADAIAAVNQDKESKGESPVEPDSDAAFEYMDWSSRNRAPTHPVNRAYNRWYILDIQFWNISDASQDPGSRQIPPHALVETTDNWVNLGLRRLLMMAVDSGADYVAIASGESVDSLRMGTPITGALYAYNSMYPKKMRDILKKIDKEAAKPEKVMRLLSDDADVAVQKKYQAELEASDTPHLVQQPILNEIGNSKQYRVFKSQAGRGPSGNIDDWLYDVFIEGKKVSEEPMSEAEADKLVERWQANLSGGHGFTRFKITDKVRQVVKQRGMPMLSMREDPPGQGDLFDQSVNEQVHRDAAIADGFDTDRILWRSTVDTGGNMGTYNIYLHGIRPANDPNAVPVWVRTTTEAQPKSAFVPYREYQRAFNAAAHNSLGAVDPDTARTITRKINADFAKKGYIGVQTAIPAKSGNGYAVTDFVAMFSPKDVREVSPSYRGNASLREQRKEPPVLNQIIANLKNTLGITTSQTMYGVDIYVGDQRMRLRPPKTMRAQYRRDTGSVGVKASRDIKAVARAGGFAIQRMLGQPLTEIQEAHKGELVPAQMLAAPSQEIMSEAFSRFFERYVMDRQGAQQMAPNFFEAFEELLDAEQPTILQDIDAVSQGYREWSERAGVDELASDLVSVYSENDWKTINDQSNNFSRTTPGRMATAWTAVVDDQAPIKQIVRRLLGIADQNGVKDENGRPISLKTTENAYKLSRMFRGAHATGYSYLTKGIPNYRGAAPVYAPLSRAMGVLFGGKQWTEQEYKDFGQYLVARRAIAEYDRLAEKEARLADLDNMIETQRELAQQARDSYTKVQNRLQSRQRGLTEREAQLRLRERDLRQITREEDRLQQRLADLSGEIADAADIIERFEIDRDTIDSQLEGLEGQLSPEIMNTLRGLAEGVDDTRGSMQRLTNRRRQLEREAARVRTRRERMQLEVDTLSTDVALTRAEVNQLVPESEIGYAALMQDEGDLTILKDERKRIQKLGASRPPTLESREHWVNYVAKVEADPRFVNVQEAAQLVYEFNFGLLTLRYQAGLIPQDQYELLAQRRDYYVPFMRDMSDIPGQSIFNAAGAGRSWSPFKKFDGSDRAIINPLEAMSQEAYRTAQHIAMNDIVKSIAGLAGRAGEGAGQIAEVLETRTNEPEAFDKIMDYAIQFGVDPADALQMAMQMEVDWTNADLDVIWKPTTRGPVAPPTVPIWIDGKRTFIQFNDPDFGQDAVNALKGLGQEQINWWIDTFAGMPSRILQIGVTTHPTFMPRNLIRDIFDAWIKVGALPFLTQIEGAKLMVQDWKGTSDFMRQYMAAGGITGGRNVAAMTQKEQQLKVLELDPNRASVSAIAMGAIAGTALGTILAGPVGGLVGAALMGYGTKKGQVLKAVESVETMTRIGVAAHAYREAKKNNPTLTEQEAIMEAAFVARDVFDWNRRGSKTLPMLRMVTFLNAQIQGMARAAEGLGGTGDRGAALARTNVARHMSIVFKRENAIDLSADEVRDLTNAYKTWGRMGLYTLSLLSLYALFADDDDYEDVLDRSKFTHTWLPDIFGVDIRIPKAFEWAVPANMIEVLWDGAMGRDPRVGERLVQSTYEVLVPPAIPQFYTLATGYLTGQNVSDIQGRNRSIVPSWEAGRAPELQFNAYTSRLARDMANAMVAIGIPDSKVPAPYMIDFTLRSGGYWGQDVTRAYDYAREAITGEPGLEPRAFQWPVIGGFTGATARTSRSVDQYYQMMSRNGGNFYRQARRYRDYIKDEGSPEDAAIALTRMTKDEKAYALVEFHGSTNDKYTHPLNRLEKINGTIAKVSRDLIANKLTPGKRRARDLSRMKDQIIELDPKTKTAIIDTLEKLRRAEGWNTMAYMNQPGWQGKKERDVAAIMATLEAVSPEAHRALLDRMREAKVRDWVYVKERWPSVEQRILSRFGAGPE